MVATFRNMNIFSSFFTDVRSSIVGWSERLDIAQKLLSLLNSYTPKEIRTACLGKSSLFCSKNSSCLTERWRSARCDVDLLQFVLMPWLKVYCTVEPRFNEPLYDKVLGITGLVKSMEQNLDITNARYNEPKGRTGEYRPFMILRTSLY